MRDGVSPRRPPPRALVTLMAGMDPRYVWTLHDPTLLIVKPAPDAYLDRTVEGVHIEASILCDALFELDGSATPAPGAPGHGCTIRRGSTRVPVDAAMAFRTQPVSLTVPAGEPLPLHRAVVRMLRAFETPVGLTVYRRRGAYEWQPRW